MSSRENVIVDTLQALQKVENVNIAKYDDEKIQVSATIDGHNVFVFIGYTGCVETCTVQGPRDESLAAHLPRLLQEAKRLPAPQDFRCLVFSIRAALQCDAYVAAHVSQVQAEASCVMRTDTIELATANGVKCAVALHPCYPQIPGCVHVNSLSLSGVAGAAGKQREDALRSELNNSLFRTLPELVAAISSIGGVSGHLPIDMRQ